jgi:hypothetical protein
MYPNEAFPPKTLAAAMFAALAGLATPPALAVDLNPGGDWQVRWDNTIRYSNGMRLQSPEVAALNPNTDDGDRSFRRGLVSNRLDLLSEFDAARDGFGLRVSAAGWFDDVYNRRNDHDSPLTSNRASVAHDEFTRAASQVAGRKAELLDWFVFGRNELGGKTLSYRLGQHSLIWGTSLFFGMNGLAKGMAPIDVYKLTIPGTQAKETTIPVPQLSAALQLTNDTSVEGYVQFRYRPTRLHPAGSFLSATDMLGDGAERMWIGDPALNGRRCGATALPPPARFQNCYVDATGIARASNDRNFGLALNTRSETLDADIGLYAISYLDTSQIIETNTAAGTYRLVVPVDPVRAVGVSLARLVGIANVGVELSLRDRQPLAVKEAVVTAADRSYVTGRTAPLNVSTTLVLPAAAFWEGASLVGEFAAQTVLSHKDVRTAVAGRWGPPGVEKLNTDRKRTSAGMRVIFTPTWYQVMPGVDLSLPINLGWSFAGLSRIDNSFPFGGSPNQTGELIVGLTGVYLNKLIANVSYINYLGSMSRQPLADRDYLRLSVQTSF